MRYWRFLIVLAFFWVLPLQAEYAQPANYMPPSSAYNGTWLLVDTRQRTIQVFDNDVPVMQISSIALGRGGPSEDRLRGDRRTPLGDFRIAWINRDSKFHIFLGLDYPTYQHARRAYDAGNISVDEFIAIAQAIRARRTPPQTTGLGGHIGLHGLGPADPDVHRIADWTQGCIAMTDDEIERLADLVQVGTPVVVR